MTKITGLPSGATVLDRTIRNIDRKNEAKRLFLLKPGLKVSSQRLAVFLSPYIVVDGDSLLDRVIDRAIMAALEQDQKNQVTAYIEAVASAADMLCTNQVSIQRDDGNWMIWDFERPLMDLLVDHGREAVQVRRRKQAFPPGPVTMALLMHVFTMRDLLLTDLGVSIGMAEQKKSVPVPVS